MRQRNFLLLLLLPLLFIAGVGVLVVAITPRKAPTVFLLELSGTEGHKVSGTYTVNGSTTEFSEVLPVWVEATGSEFAYKVRLVGPKGQIHGQLLVDGVRYGSSAGEGTGAGVSGEFRLGSFLRGTQAMFTTLSGEEARNR